MVQFLQFVEVFCDLTIYDVSSIIVLLFFAKYHLDVSLDAVAFVLRTSCRLVNDLKNYR